MAHRPGGLGRSAKAGQAPPVPDRRWALFAAFVPVAVALDQVTKHLADRHLAGRIGGMHEVVEGFFMLFYSTNRGAFFSIGEGLPDGVRVAFFTAAAVLALAAILFFYRGAEASRTGLRLGLLLLAAGAVGNLIDRLAHGEVIDFLHVHYQNRFHWATFNVADIYITIGVGLLLWDAVRIPGAVRTTEGAGTT